MASKTPVQRTVTVVSTAIQGGVKTVTTVRTHERPRGKRSGATWLALEFAGLIVYKVGSVIGHALAEILMGRQP